MPSELREISPSQRELHIEVDAASIKDAYAKISQRYANGANVPGFRKGHAPLDVVRIRYKDEIKQEVIQLLLPDKVTEALQEHGLQPLSEPQLHIEDVETVKVNGSEPLKLHVHVEVMPDIGEPEYKGLELVRRVKPVEDSEIEDLIENRLNNEAALIPVEDRPSEIGDTVIVDLEGKFDDDPEGEPITAEDLEIKLGDEVIESSFTENLVGVREDDEKEFTLAYPQDFSAEALAGRTVHYKAKVKSVGRMETPEANDEWALSLDEGYESIAELRSKLRDDLESMAKGDAEARLRNNAIAKLIEKNPVEVPRSLIENQARNLLNNFARDLQQRGADLSKLGEDFVQMAFSQMHSQAERDVAGAILLEKIQELENIDVAEAELEEEIERMAKYYGVEATEVRSSLEQQDGLRGIENNLRMSKAIEAIISNAKVTDGPWVDENEKEPAVAEAKPGKKAKAAADGEKKKPVKKRSAKADS